MAFTDASLYLILLYLSPYWKSEDSVCWPLICSVCELIVVTFFQVWWPRWRCRGPSSSDGTTCITSASTTVLRRGIRTCLSTSPHASGKTSTLALSLMGCKIFVDPFLWIWTHALNRWWAANDVYSHDGLPSLLGSDDTALWHHWCSR